MLIRDLDIKDLREIDENKVSPLPSLKSCVLKRTVENGKFIGSVLVEVTTETTLVFNKESSTRDRYCALRLFEEEMLSELPKKGYRNTHLVVPDEKFANIMIKHFDYSKEKGIFLYREK